MIIRFFSIYEKEKNEWQTDNIFVFMSLFERPNSFLNAVARRCKSCLVSYDVCMANGANFGWCIKKMVHCKAINGQWKSIPSKPNSNKNTIHFSHPK